MNDDHSIPSRQFSSQETKDQRLLIYWGGRQVMVLKGKAALKLQLQLRGKSEAEKQLILAKATGNFKRGNEKNPYA